MIAEGGKGWGKLDQNSKFIVFTETIDIKFQDYNSNTNRHLPALLVFDFSTRASREMKIETHMNSNDVNLLQKNTRYKKRRNWQTRPLALGTFYWVTKIILEEKILCFLDVFISPKTVKLPLPFS